MPIEMPFHAAYYDYRPPAELSALRLARVGGQRPLQLRIALYLAVVASGATLLALQLQLYAAAFWSASCVLPSLLWAWWLYASQVHAYAAAAKAADSALKVHSAKLEQQVREGTNELLMLAQELSLSNDELRREMNARAKIELELRQAQKLESVGRLASGVAHEINTPVQFVSDSCYFLRDGVADLTALIGDYRATLAGLGNDCAGLAQARADIAAKEAERDLHYLLENLPAATTRSLEGLERVATIVRAMIEFAHPDRKDKTHADINQAIQSTLVIAHNEYKYVADLETDFGQLPPVLCYLSELNQAVLNIIVNSAHAIADQVEGTENRGQISVRTRQDGADVVITISDTGGGIPEAIRDKVFDPFFTTKEVGKGTGQGLGVVHSVIVDKHGGSVSFDSEAGVGTTFTLRIPIAASAAERGA